MADDLRAAITMGYRILQLDEMMVTKRTFPTCDWSKLRQNTHLDLSQTNTDPIAVLGAVSREKGVELVMTFPRSVNVPKFKVFLEELRARNPFDQICLVLDNLAVHRNQHAVGRMRELGFRWTFTPISSPEYNGGIESTWSQSKKWIKEQRLNAIVNKKEINLKEMVEKSFE